MFPCLTKFLFIEVSNGEAEHTNHKNYTVLQRKRWRRNKGFHPVIKCLMRTKDLNGQKSPMSKSMDDELRCVRQHRHITISQGAIKLQALSYTVDFSFSKVKSQFSFSQNRKFLQLRIILDSKIRILD